MRLIVTGASGFLGNHVVDELLTRGHEVVGVDTNWFGPCARKDHPLFTEIVGDVRDGKIADQAFRDPVDAVIYLAAISNDPAGALDEAATMDVNCYGAVFWAERAREEEVKRFVYTSSCSIFGGGGNLEVDPLTAYARSKWAAERDLADQLSTNEFFIKVLRLGTLYGISPRMRFDLAVNLMARDFAETGKITVTGGGQQCRPFVNVLSAAHACCSEALRGPDCKRFVVGFNAKILDLARAFVLEDEIDVIGDNPDPRNYYIPLENQVWGSFMDAKNTFDTIVTKIKGGTWQPTDADKYYTARVLKKVLRGTAAPIPLCEAEHDPEMHHRLVRTFLDNNGYASPGPVVQEFEAKCAEILGVNPSQVVATNSCTSALLAAAFILGFKGHHGRKVFLPSITWGATANAFSLLAANSNGCLHYVDVDDRGMLNPAGLLEQVNGGLDVVCTVDLGGRLSNLSQLCWNVPTGTRIVVDAAHSFGRKFDDRADFMCFSFAPTKNLQCGDGGLLVMKQDCHRQLALRFLTNGMEPTSCGGSVKYGPGIKGRMNDYTASIALGALATFHITQTRRFKARARYLHLFEETGLRDKVSVVQHYPKDQPHLFQILTDRAIPMAKVFKQADIGFGVHYYSLGGPSLKGAREWDLRTLSLPFWSQITEAKQTRVVEVIKEAVR